MVFRLLVENLIIKSLSSDYYYLYSQNSHNQILLGNSLSFLISGSWFDSTRLPISVSLEDQRKIEHAALKNRDFFEIDNDNAFTAPSLSDNTVITTDVFTEKICTILAKNPKPWWIMIEAVTACNLSCKHCYNCNTHTFISPDNVHRLMSLLDKDDNCHVVLTGGEIMLHPQLFEILYILKDYNKVVSFISNGTLITKNRLDEIISSGCIVGSFQLSLYSVNPEIHDRITGKVGSWQKTVDAIGILKQYGYKVVIASLIVPSNVDQVAALIKFAREQSVQIRFCFKCVSNCHDACANSDCDLSVEGFTQAFSDYLSHINSFHLSKKESYGNHICMAGISKCTLGADGSLFLCPTWKEYPFTNIADISSFEAFWNGKEIQRIRSITKDDFTKCNSCNIQEYCRPCLADNFNKNRDIMKIHDSHCVLEQIKHTIELKRMNQDKANDS